MRSGTWNGRRTLDNARVTVNGTVRPVRDVTIRSGMRDGHPASDTSSWCIEATIEWIAPPLVFTSPPHPFSGGPEWMPKVGDEVVVETGDGALGVWWVQHRGVIDTSSGSFGDVTATSNTVDAIDELGNTLSLPPLLNTHPPRLDSDLRYRRQGLQSLFIIDRTLRNTQRATGWYATPWATWQTLGTATGMGSLWPGDVGELTYGHRHQEPSSWPEFVPANYGLAPANYEAEYALDLTTGYSNRKVIFSAAVPPVVNMPPQRNHWRAEILNDTDHGVRVWHQADTDRIYWRTTDGLNSESQPAVDPATGRRAERFALYFDPAAAAILRFDDGRESTATFHFSSSWQATRVVIDCPRVGGWWIIEGEKVASQRWATLEHTPTARLRQRHIIHMEASRGLQWTAPADYLGDQLAAECSAMWLDEDGVMQWAGRDVLDDQPVTHVVTSNLVDAVDWGSSRHSLGRSVHLQHLQPWVRRAVGGYRIDCWQDGSSDLAPGEEDVLTINVPSDEDWVDVDATTRLMSASTTPAQYLEGSWHGGTVYEDSEGGGQGWVIGVSIGLARLALRSWQATVGSWSNNQPGWRIKTTIPDVSGRLSELFRGEPAIRLRSKAKVTWVEGEREQAAGSVGPSRYNHDVGWHVQEHWTTNRDSLNALLAWLAGVVSSTNPTMTGLVLAHDPRRQIGDKIRVEDRDVTGVWLEVLVQERITDVADFTDTIRGRVTAHGNLTDVSLPSPSGHTALTPATDWNRDGEVA